jgi:hypothetical protein
MYTHVSKCKNDKMKVRKKFELTIRRWWPCGRQGWWEEVGGGHVCGGCNLPWFLPAMAVLWFLLAMMSTLCFLTVMRS